jgi:release factor glutamine methyltransferase
LAWTTTYFTRKSIDSPRLSAEMLLAHVLETTRLKLYTEADRPASDLERAAFRELVERAALHEPVDYLVGQAPFFSMMLKVNPAVLIPRPSTETLVEHIIQHARLTPGFRAPLVADVGTGSGAIAIALAKNIPDCRVLATDQSAAALALAGENAKAQGVADRIEFVQGDLLAPLAGKRFRYLASNPPYISDREWAAVLPNVKDYEPVGALRGGDDGLDFIRPIIRSAADVLERPGQLVLEFADSQRDIVLQLAAEAGLRDGRVLADHEGLPRVLVAEVR